jgi:hypothetical protein
MIKNHLKEDELLAYSQYKLGYKEFFVLSQEQFDNYEIHVSQCESCQKEFLILQNELLHITSTKSKSSFSYPYILLAASILIAFSIFYFFPFNKQTDIIKKGDTYAINLELEYLLDNSLRENQFEVISPKNHEHFKKNIPFVFSNLDSMKTMFLIIMNNQETIVYEHQISEKSFHLEVDIEPAYYYWHIEDKDEVLHYGSFYLDKD